MLEQKTIGKKVHFSGIGLHGGRIANVNLLPSGINSGITLIRTDVKDKNNTIKCSFENVSEAIYSTKITNSDGVFVNTIEHLMAALWAMKISNLTIEIDSEEMPIMDGCSQGFTFLIEAAGIQKQQEIRKILHLNHEISVEYPDGRKIVAKPADSFIATFHLTDKSQLISHESGYTFDAKNSSFINDISLARTYCKLEEVEKLKSMNLALGGTLNNALVVSENKILNDGGLRYPNEFTRHKILDLIGDIALCDYYICAHFTGYNSGHEMNNALLRKIFSDENHYRIV